MVLSKRARRLVIKALDEWGHVKYYHQLIEIMVDQSACNLLELYSNCYLKLSKEHREELETTLEALKQEILDQANS